LHLWWARRPLAACRAVLFAQLVDDPSSWPERFPTEEAQGMERKRLHDFIGGTKGANYKDGLVAWENSNNERVLNKARWYIARSLAWGRGEEAPDEDDPDAVRRYLLDHAPPVYDPFCGGGSIPLEAQRLGLRAYGSDLNPVAVMISKALVEFPPKFAGLPPANPEARRKLANGGAWNAKGAQGLAEDVRYYGRWMRDEAEKRIGHLYPDVELPDGSKATVIAWLWARTVASPNPAARGAHVPLVSSFMLSTKAGKEAWVEPVLDSSARDGYRFEIRTGKADSATFERAKKGTKSSRGANFVCVLTGTPITPAHIKSEGKAKRMGARLMAIVAESERGRIYLPPDQEHERAAARANPTWAPEQALPHDPGNFWTVDYGLTTFADLFTARQLVALTTFSGLVLEARAKALEDARAAGMAPDPTPLAERETGMNSYANALCVALAFLVSRLADRSSSICSWDIREGQGRKAGIRNVFSRQAIPMTWDYAEANPLSGIAASIDTAILRICDVLDALPLGAAPASVKNADAAAEDHALDVFVATDPPYYDNIGYADLSDFFYVWLRPTLREVFPREFATVLVPKEQELVATPYRHGSKEEAEKNFLRGMSRAIGNIAKVSTDEVPVTIYYAFKQNEVEKEGVVSTGWATFLGAVISAGFQVDGTWPMRTELGNRMIGRGANALASSIVLVCRKRPERASSVTRGEFLRALRAELPKALHTLQESAIAPVDMAQASIGPGMAVFSRYKEVLEAGDTPMSVREALRIINAELDAYLAKQEGDYDSWTRFAVTWFQQHGFGTEKYGQAEVLANARNVSVQGVADAGIISSRANQVRLLRRDELPDGYLPFADSRQTVWEGCQHLIKCLEGEGEEGAARLAKQLGYQADMAGLSAVPDLRAQQVGGGGARL
jgi:putative DNA methylase